MHLEAISNGQGAPSLYMLWLAGQKRIPATLSITADTGAERDMLWSDGTRSTAAEYFEQITKPFAEEMGLEAVFVRARDGQGNPLPPLDEAHMSDDFMDIPLFGDEGGRLQQSCTSKWKIAAIRQEARRRGAKTFRTAIGMTLTEVRRVKLSDRKWHTHYYPLIFDYPIHRASIITELERINVPYLVSTECDVCPNKDTWRWLNSTRETVEQANQLEAFWRSQGLYLTKQGAMEGKPIIELYDEWQQVDQMKPGLFDCPEGGYCGVG